jgi:hypothetical protein
VNNPSDDKRELTRPQEILSLPESLVLRARWRIRSISNRRLAALAVGLAVGVATWFVVQSAQAGQAQWGDRVPVLIAAEHIPAGIQLNPSNTRLRPYPLALVPHGAITELNGGRYLNYPVSAGQVIVARQSSRDRHGLTSGTRSVTLPQPLAAPALEVGDSVELIAVRSDLGGAVATTLGIATVSDRTESEITVVVDRLLVGPIFRALGSGSVEFARRPPQG